MLLTWLAGTAAVLAVVWYVGIAFSVDARARVLGTSLSRAADDIAAGVTSKTSH
jgi:hypothetical protein